MKTIRIYYYDDYYYIITITIIILYYYYNDNTLNYSFINTVVFLATNKLVDDWNEKIQTMNPNPSTELLSEDVLHECDDPHQIIANMIDDNVLNQFEENGIPPHKLTLKVEDIVILMRHIDKTNGFTNNRRVQIISISQYRIRVKMVDSLTVKFAEIPRFYFEVKLPYGKSFTMKRKQFPIRLAYSMTMNKSQGQQFHRVLLDVRSPPFSHGHLYVAASRIRHARDIAYYGDAFPKNFIDVENTVIITYNVVYDEIINSF